MDTASAARDDPRPAPGRLLAVVAAIAGAFALFLVTDLGGTAVSRAVVNLAWVLVSGGVAILVVRAARRCTGAARRAWGFLSASMILWWGGQVTWTLLEEVAGTISPFPSAADIGFTAALPLGLVGVLSFPIGGRSVPARLRRATDALIAAAATFCLAWLLILDDLPAGGSDPLERAVALSYPIATGAVASVVLMMLSRVRRERQAVFGFLAAGLLLNALCTTVFAVQQLDGSYATGNATLEVAWLAGLCLMGAAAHRCRDASDVSGEATSDAPSVAGTLLVYLPIGAAILAGVVTGRFFEEGGVGPPFVLAGITVVVLMAVRQLLTIAENVQLSRVVQTTADHYEALVRNSSDLVLVTDGYDNLVEISPSVERILGYRVDDVIGTSLRPLVHPDDLSALDEVTAEVLEHGTGRAELRVLDARHHGWRWIDAMVTNLLDDPSIGGVVVNARDTTDRHHAEEALSHQAAHDALTDLPNRSMLLARLDAVPAGAPVAVLFCDLDGFKAINDTHGHERGDEVLRAVAGRLRNGLRPGEMVARFGGDEFVILCEGVAEPTEATAIATRVADSLRTSISVSGTELVVSATIGARLAVGPCDAATVVNDADAAMYVAKGRLGGAIEVFDDSLRERSEGRRRTEAAIRRVIEADDAIVLHYQPLWRITDGEPVLVGAEALLRWPDADGRLVGPAGVVRVAEETGLIVPLGARILQEACRELARWHQAGARLTMAVNVSARQLGDPGLVVDVESALAATGAPAEALVLEVTETALMDDPVRALDTLRRLRALGISLAIDDFGTGYCSLSYLSAFPVQLLKVDGTFVTQMTANQQDRTIVASVIGLAHALGIAALGEGVESEHQLDMLREMGCDQAQGFLLGVPAPGHELLARAGLGAVVDR